MSRNINPRVFLLRTATTDAARGSSTTWYSTLVVDIRLLGTVGMSYTPMCSTNHALTRETGMNHYNGCNPFLCSMSVG
eukprot:scaffold122299_cov56-Attheya_sp.AAC.1